MMDQTQQATYRERLEQMRTRLVDEVNLAGELIPELVRKNGENSVVPTHIADQDSEGLDAEIALKGTQRDVLIAVDEALGRLDTGRFGQCSDCGVEIVPERLDLLPYTAYCTGCAQKREDVSS